MRRDLSLTRIGVFYDGNYFFHVSNYYNYYHSRRSRLSIAGLHHFIKKRVAEQEGIDERFCQIVDAHYFRGRLSAREVAQHNSNLFYSERVFDDVLSSEGVVTHYLPVKTLQDGLRHEKGIDVWLALEAFEAAFYRRFDILVLIASDGDYVPLVRKLNTLGLRVMVLGWDFEYINSKGEKRGTRTSQELLEEVTYPVDMHEVIDNRVTSNSPLINNLFLSPSSSGFVMPSPPPAVQAPPAPTGVADLPTPQPTTTDSSLKILGKIDLKELASSTKDHFRNPGVEIVHYEDGTIESTIESLKGGYGFIHYKPSNLFFHFSSVEGKRFADLRVGERVRFVISSGIDGSEVAGQVQALGTSAEEPLKAMNTEIVHNEDGTIESYIVNLRDSYGFIYYKPANLFFHLKNLKNARFHDLREGDRVRFAIIKGDKGSDVAGEIELLEEGWD